MTYYEVLGVSPQATDAEIKRAYRSLVKKYHPDRNKSPDATQRIAQINEAYDVLSDPQRKYAYDHPAYLYEEYVEDPREAARREYRMRKAREAKEAEAKTIAREKLVFKIARWVSFPLVAAAFVFLLDDWLPVKEYKEVAKVGWQERRGGSGRYSQRELVSFMETEHFEFPVPNEIHLHYDYYDKPDTLTIGATQIFKTVKGVQLKTAEDFRYWGDPYTLYSSIIPWHYLLFFSALFTALRKEYNLINFSLCFLPLLLAAIILVFYVL